MKHLAPSIFRAFACAASRCPDSCCRAGWEIVIDPETLARYESLPGPDGDRVRKAVVPGEEALLRQDRDRVCVLLDPDGLCHAQRRFGHESLCRVCREYPRFHREFGNLTEHGLSLSCPAAYAMAVSAPLRWEQWEDDAPIVPNELDPERYLCLRAGRTCALQVLAREDLPFFLRLDRVVKIASAAGRGYLPRHDPALRMRRWASLRLPAAAPPSAEQKALLSIADRFASLEILSPSWVNALCRFRMILRGEADALRSTSVRELLTPSDPEPYARWLACSLYKYWMDALDDGDLTGRVNRSVGMTLLGLAMDNALPDEGPFLCRISREIEHCEENLQALLEQE